MGRGRFYIFEKGYNKILDLLDENDSIISKIYADFVNALPYEVTDKTYKLKDFPIYDKNYVAEMSVMQNSIWLDVVNYKPYARFEVYVHRLYEEHLCEDDMRFRIFRFGYRNTVEKRPDVKLKYEEVDGKYIFKGTMDDPKEKVLDWFYELTLEKREEDYYLIATGVSRGIEFYKKETKMSFYDLVEYTEDEDEYEEDFDVEFDADFEI